MYKLLFDKKILGQKKLTFTCIFSVFLSELALYTFKIGRKTVYAVGGKNMAKKGQ